MTTIEVNISHFGADHHLTTSRLQALANLLLFYNLYKNKFASTDITYTFTSFLSTYVS